MTRGNVIRWLLASLMAASFILPQNAVADGWGDLKGQLIFDGDVPAPKLKVKKGDDKVRDAKCCAAQNVEDDTLVVNPKNKGIAHAFVYLRKVKSSEIHPELKESEEKEVKFDQKGCKFNPHALVVRTDQIVTVLSDDPIPHNTHTFPILNKGENVIIAPNDRVGIKFPKFVTKEPLPFEVKCDIHPWMSARWLIVDHPYAAVTDKDGKFEIKNLPEGEIKVTFWHEKVGYIEKDLEIDIEDGEATEVEVKAPAAKFEDK